MIHIDDRDGGDAGPALNELAELVGRYGGYAAPEASCLVRDGELTVHATPVLAKQARLFEIPVSCMPRWDAFHVEVQNERFSISAVNKDVDALEQANMEALLAVYNACWKVTAWRRASPWFALAADPSVLDKLMSARTAAPKIEHLYRLHQSGDTETLMLDSFSGARVYNLGSGKNGTTGGQVILSFIDFLNHHCGARGFQVRRNDAGQPHSLWTHGDQPVSSSTECFTYYTFMDRLTSYLVYGFVDESAHDLMSTALELDVGNGVALKVLGQAGAPFQGNLPEGMEELRPLVPQIRNLTDTAMTVQRLIIPANGRVHDFRRVLALLISSMSSQSKSALNRLVQEAEHRILAQNLAYYAELLHLCEHARQAPPSSPPAGRDEALDAVTRLAHGQRDQLTAYAQNAGLDL